MSQPPDSNISFRFQPMPQPLEFIQWPLAIVGLGVTGKAIFNLLIKLGISKELITTFDDKDPNAKFTNYQTLLNEFSPKTICVSPGVPLKTKWITEFLTSGGLLTSELDISFRLLDSEKTVAVTGALGKSTTVSLIGHALESVDSGSFIGGNLGTPLAQYVLDKLEGRRTAPWVVLELSSYQLENFASLHCDFSAITYFTANHMERYDSKDEYYHTKWSLLSRTKYGVVLNKKGGDLLSWSLGKKSPAPIDWVDQNSELLKRYKLESPALLGQHNLDNIALAARLLELMNISKEGIQSLALYRGLPHRVENLGKRKGVLYVNDSKATTIESVLTATQSTLQNLKLGAKLFLLIGGKDKNLPWEDLSVLKNKNEIEFIFFGQCRKIALQKSGLKGNEFEFLGPAIEFCKAQAVENDIVLLSPGGTSLDEFKNFEDRGSFFRQLVFSENKT